MGLPRWATFDLPGSIRTRGDRCRCRRSSAARAKRPCRTAGCLALPAASCWRPSPAPVDGWASPCCRHRGSTRILTRSRRVTPWPRPRRPRPVVEARIPQAGGRSGRRAGRHPRPGPGRVMGRRSSRSIDDDPDEDLAGAVASSAVEPTADDAPEPPVVADAPVRPSIAAVAAAAAVTPPVEAPPTPVEPMPPPVEQVRRPCPSGRRRCHRSATIADRSHPS